MVNFVELGVCTDSIYNFMKTFFLSVQINGKEIFNKEEQAKEDSIL